jgi:hypothetical protein
LYRFDDNCVILVNQILFRLILTSLLWYLRFYSSKFSKRIKYKIRKYKEIYSLIEVLTFFSNLSWHEPVFVYPRLLIHLALNLPESCTKLTTILTSHSLESYFWRDALSLGSHIRNSSCPLGSCSSTEPWFSVSKLHGIR